MNILIVNYGDASSNSMNHIAEYANGLVAKGHQCAVSITSRETTETNKRPEKAYFQYFSHHQIKDGINAFPDARPAEIIHAWTPRETVRKTVEGYRSHYPTNKLIIHLEDNEDAILESYYQKDIAELRTEARASPDFDWQQEISHPLHYKRFLASADAITLLNPNLRKLLPIEKPNYLIRPILSQTTVSSNLPASVAIPDDRTIIYFPGGVTSNNREDVRNLFIAIKLLNDRGHPTTLIKSGPSCEVLRNSFEFPLNDIVLDVGELEKAHVQELYSRADILIQPGRPNEFNEDRFPCKIPEFLQSGTPSIIPYVYAELLNCSEDICLYLRSSTPEEIADNALKIIRERAKGESMAQAAAKYARRTFHSEENVDRLIEIYQETRKLTATEKSNIQESLELRIAARTAERDELQKAALQIKEENRTVLLRNNQIATEKKEIADKYKKEKNRNKRIKTSASWKLTAPLRFLRRKFLDPKTKNQTSHLKAKPTPEACSSQVPPADHPCFHKDYFSYCKILDQNLANYTKQFNARLADAQTGPKISILLPVFNVDEIWLRECIESVVNQLYQNWELCISDDCSPAPHIKKVIEEYLVKDSRIKAIFREENGHISKATNSAFTLATGEYIALLDHDDVLTEHALAKVADTVRAYPSAKIIYSDEDKIDESGIRHGPHFKSDWNYDLFLGCNIISHLGVYKRSAFEKAGGFRSGYEGAQDWDLALRISELCEEDEIQHIPDVLYHWRSIVGSTAHNIGHKDYAHEAQKRAIESHLKRTGTEASLESIKGIHWRVKFKLPEAQPSVSIIIPTKDRIDLLKPCIESILAKTTYQNYEILIVDNDSQEDATIDYFAQISENQKIRVLEHNGEFNYSRINNRAIEQSQSELICLLNNDTEVITGEWLSEMISHALRPTIGVVGAKLLFPHDHVQHCGVIMGLGGIAGHAFKYLHKDDDGHIHRALLTSQYSATTGACMVFRKKTWNQLEGLDEINLPIAYNDVDFCLRASKAGLRTIVTPYSCLVHKESESRGDDRTKDDQTRFLREQAYMQNQWGNTIQRDPYYSPHFSKRSSDFTYAC